MDGIWVQTALRGSRKSETVLMIERAPAEACYKPGVLTYNEENVLLVTRFLIAACTGEICVISSFDQTSVWYLRSAEMRSFCLG